MGNYHTFLVITLKMMTDHHIFLKGNVTLFLLLEGPWERVRH